MSLKIHGAIDVPAPSETASAARKHILRFALTERLLHWAIAVPFLVCYVTAAILFFYYNPDPQRPHRAIFSWAHRISGVCLLLLPALVLLFAGRRDWRLHLYNVKQGWGWSLKDLKWLALMGAAVISKRVKLPEQGKFNAGEKLNFMMVMTFVPMLIVTGIVIWLPGVSIVAWIAHIAMAALATPLMLGHMFMATINPSTRVALRGMFTGYVDRQWAEHHHGDWYREQVRPLALAPAPTPRAAQAVPPMAFESAAALAPAPRAAQPAARMPAAPPLPELPMMPQVIDEPVEPWSDNDTTAGVYADEAADATEVTDMTWDAPTALRAPRGTAAPASRPIPALSAETKEALWGHGGYPYPHALHALCLERLRQGATEEALRYGHEALRVGLQLNLVPLLCDLLRALLPHRRALQLERGEIFALVEALSAEPQRASDVIPALLEMY